MKKAVSHLIPFMERERKERRARQREQGIAEEEDVRLCVCCQKFVDFHMVLSFL